MTEPTDEELAAIVAAVELAWPRPAPVALAPSEVTTGAWRWSGRWWGPLNEVSGRRRPWQR